jgi:hypothetical protein
MFKISSNFMDKVLKMIKLGEFPRVVAGDVPQISMII